MIPLASNSAYPFPEAEFGREGFLDRQYANWLSQPSPSAASDFSRPPARHWRRPTALANLDFPYSRLTQLWGKPRFMTPATGPQGWGQTNEAGL